MFAQSHVHNPLIASHSVTAMFIAYDRRSVKLRCIAGSWVVVRL